MLRPVSIFILLMLSGFVVGRLVSGNSRSSSGAIPDDGFTPSARTSSRPAKDHPVLTAEELMRRMQEKSKVDPNSSNLIEEELKSWSIAELKTALDDVMLETDFQVSNYALWGLTRILMSTLIERDVGETCAWLVGIPNPVARAKMIQVAGDLWPEEKAETGLQMVFSHKDAINDALAQPFLTKGFLLRCKDGPVAVGKLFAEIRADQRAFPLQAFELPAGFDFTALARQPGFEINLKNDQGLRLMEMWYQSDRDRAYDWLLENNGTSALLERRIGGTVDLKWLGSRFHEVKAEDRPAYLGALYENLLRGDSDPFAEIDNKQPGQDFISALSNPDDVAEVATLGARLLFSHSPGKGLNLLEAVKDPAQRLQILESATPEETSPDSARPEMSPEDATKLRAALQRWNADEAQVERLLNKFSR